MNRSKKTNQKNILQAKQEPASSSDTALKEHIIKAAQPLFNKYGIKSLSVTDISRQLSISKQSFYSCFSSKRTLVEQLVTKKITEKRNDLLESKLYAGNPIEEVFLQWSALCNFLRQFNGQFFFQVKKYYPAAYIVVKVFQYDFLYTHIKSNLERGMLNGIYRNSLKPTIISRLLANGLLFPQGEKPQQTLEAGDATELQLLTYHLHAIASEKGIKLINTYQSEWTERYKKPLVMLF